MWELMDATVSTQKDPVGLKLSVTFGNSLTQEVRLLDWCSWGEVQYLASGASERLWRASFLAPVWEREDMALLTLAALHLSQQLAGLPYKEACEKLRAAELGSWWDL